MDKLTYLHRSYKWAIMIRYSREPEKAVIKNNCLNWVISNCPKRLFKYRACDLRNFNTLRDKKAWFSSPSTWNDGIDVTVKYDLESDFRYIEEHYDEYVSEIALAMLHNLFRNNWHYSVVIDGKLVFSLDKSIFKTESGELDLQRIRGNLIGLVGHTRAGELMNVLHQALEKAKSEEFKAKYLSGLKQFASLNEIRNTVLMYSMSETPKNDNQWAHYADEGRGFCIGYRMIPKTELDKDLFRELVPIHYGPKRKISIARLIRDSAYVAAGELTADDVALKEAKGIFVSTYTKKKQWAGEQEWRTSIKSQGSEGKLVPFDFAESLYLGDKISEANKKDLLIIAKELNLSIYQRSLDLTQSKWNYKKIRSKVIWGKNN